MDGIANGIYSLQGSLDPLHSDVEDQIAQLL